MASKKDPAASANMTLLAAHPDIHPIVKRALSRFTTMWGWAEFDVIIIGTKKGTGPRAAKKIREALEEK